jgi:cytochrome P450
MTSAVSATTPISDIDPYSDTALIDPWSTYAELQNAGPAVWLSKYKMFALTRYDSAVKALQDSASFPSSLGVMMNDHMNQFFGAMLFVAMAKITVAFAASS